MRGGFGEQHEAVRARIQRYEDALRDELGVAIGEGTTWGTFAYSTFNVESYDRENWPAMADWLHEKIVDYRRVLEPNSPSIG